MAVFRAALLILLLLSVGCFGAYMATGQPQWRRRGLAIVRWTVFAALGFFAVLIAERLLR